jgi:hypothetical protein
MLAPFVVGIRRRFEPTASNRASEIAGRSLGNHQVGRARTELLERRNRLNKARRGSKRVRPLSPLGARQGSSRARLERSPSVSRQRERGVLPGTTSAAEVISALDARPVPTTGGGDELSATERPGATFGRRGRPAPVGRDANQSRRGTNAGAIVSRAHGGPCSRRRHVPAYRRVRRVRRSAPVAWATWAPLVGYSSAAVRRMGTAAFTGSD